MNMNILITNDDGYKAKGIHYLAEIMCQFGNITVIAPKRHQSGMSTAVSLGQDKISYKELPEEKNGKWAYLDATPASCIKYGFNFKFRDIHPDVVVCGINHGSNAASAACYSGTLGAAEEAALNNVPSIAVSIDDGSHDPDFSAVGAYFPDIFRKIMSSLPDKYGIFYNINFPGLPADKIIGTRIGRQGLGKWVREFVLSGKPLEGRNCKNCDGNETLYNMTGDFMDSDLNTQDADHWLMNEGFISIVPDKLDKTDYMEKQRLEGLGFNVNF